jgi:hypothetical protein
MSGFATAGLNHCCASSWWAEPRDEHVAAVQIRVDQGIVVQVRERREQLPGDLEQHPVLEGLAQDAAEAGVAALERDVEQVIVLERVVDIDDVRVAEALEPLHLRRPFLLDRLVVPIGRAEHLQRIGLVERPDAFVHRAVLPVADELADGVAAAGRRQHRPWHWKRDERARVHPVRHGWSLSGRCSRLGVEHPCWP